MGWEQDLIFHTILKISSCSFKYECREVWTFCNFQFELRTESSIFHLILNIALQSILLFTFISHNDTRIKASNVSNFNEACEWLSIAICLMVLLSQIAILERMRSIVCCQSFMRCGILVYHSLMPPQNCHASYYDFFLDLCLKCFCKGLNNSALPASFSTAINPNYPMLMINLSNHYSGIVSRTSSSHG